MRCSLRSFWFHKSYKNYKTRKKKNVKECSILFIRLKKNLTFFFKYIFIYIYLYIYIGKKHTTFCGFCKRTKPSHVLLSSLQKNKTFSAFFYNLCKRTMRSLRSFTFLRKESKRMHRSFGSHKSPKTRKRT